MKNAIFNFLHVQSLTATEHGGTSLCRADPKLVRRPLAREAYRVGIISLKL